MLKRIVQTVLALCLITATTTAQVNTVKEEVAGEAYRITFRNSGYPYEIDQRQHRISFSGVSDISRPGEFAVPQREIFIAIPPQSMPSYSFRKNSVRTIPNVTPSLQPIARKVNDSLVVYDDVTVSRNATVPGPTLRFNGYLWVENAYCMHFTLFPYTVNSGGVEELTEFSIDVPVGRSARTVKTIRQRSNPFIDNPSVGSQWLVEKPVLSVAATDSWIDYAADYVKLGVNKDAIYRLTLSDLQAYGVPVASVDPRSFKLFMAGKEQPIYVSGQQDGSFDANDFVEFLGRRNYGDTRYRQVPPFGKPYYEYLNRYSDTTIYWLTWNAGNGKRIDTVLSSPGAAKDTLKYYDELLRIENNYYYDFSLNPSTLGQVRREEPEIYENETWHEGNIGVGKRTINFTASKLFSGKPAHAYVKLQDYSTNSTSPTDSDHVASLTINALPTVYDLGIIAKYQQKTLTADFSSSLISNGTVSVNINSIATTKNPSQSNLMISDWYELEYPRQTSAVNDSLVLSYRSALPNDVSLIVATGMTSTSPTVIRFNASDSSVVKVTNYSRTGDSLLVLDSVRAGFTYFISSPQRTSKPFFFYKKKFVNLRSGSRKADYIAITHPYFQSVTNSYLTFIQQSYGVTATAVNVFDIYDEFNYGFLAAEPIREFLKTAASNWQVPAPRSVLLIGKATYDFYGNKTKYFGAPRLDIFVPSYGAPVSDYWYTIWDTTGANVPMMSIGRIPAKTVDEFQEYVLRHQNYLSKGYDDWNKTFLFYSGGSTGNQTEISQCRNANEAVVNSFVTPRPIGGNAVSFYKTVSPLTNFGPYSNEFYRSTVDNGGVFISYIGHSGTQTWDNSIADVTQLSNIRDRNPLITDFGCSTAKHAEPNVLSFSEIFLVDPKGQAITYIGNSSLGFTSTAYTFPTVFYKKLLVDTSVSIGESHRLAKIDFMKSYGATGSYRLFTMTNTVLGDPIVKLPLPEKPNFSFAKTTPTVEQDRLNESDDSAVVRLPYFNLGRAPSDSLVIQWQHRYNGTLLRTVSVKRVVPSYADTIEVTVPVKNMPGEHVISAVLDNNGSFNEIYENDNTEEFSVSVASSSVRPLSIAPYATQTTGVIPFLNPTSAPGKTSFLLSIGSNAALTSAQTFTVPMDTFQTNFTVPPQFAGKRIWMQARFDTTVASGLGYSYFVGTKNNIVLNDASTFRRGTFFRTSEFDGTVKLDTTSIELTAISAGGNAGATAVVSKDGQNLTPSSNLTGHHVAVFDTLTYSLVYFNRFNNVSGSTAVTAYGNMLDTLTGKYMIVIAVCSDGYTNITPALRSKLKQFGSVYIDSLTGLYSWAFIGRRGASVTAVKEKFSRAIGTSGRVQVDTILRLPNTAGTFTTESFGPVAAWSRLDLRTATPAGSGITVNVFGVKEDRTADTVLAGIPADTLISVAAVDAAVYPSLRIVGTLKAGTNGVSPTLSSLGIDYTPVAELGTNYQLFRALRVVDGADGGPFSANDTIVQGEKVRFRYRIANAGGSTANNVTVRVQTVWENGTVEPVTETVIDSLPMGAKKEFVVTYNTSLGAGKRSLKVIVDPDTLVRESFRDNNTYLFPFVIAKSPGKPVLPNLAIGPNAVTSTPVLITDRTDTATFRIVYGNTGTLSNDSVSIRIRHYDQSSLLSTTIVRRKYPVAYDTIVYTVAIGGITGQHQILIDLDYTGLITESNESDNTASYFFTVATTDFAVISPTEFGLSAVDRIVFLDPTVGGTELPPVTLQIDTLPAFPSPQSFNKTMEPFSTTFLLPGLKKKMRYHWRVKVATGTHEWTTGSFYSGDSASTVIGQQDSIAWNRNTFTRTSFSRDSGVSITDTRVTITSSSAGFYDGNTASVTVNGVNVLSPILGSSHNLVVLDSSDFSIIARQRFDVTSDAAEADSLIAFIGRQSAGVYVIDAVVDDGANNLSAAARNALKSIGSAKIDLVTYRDSWTIIGRKGAAAGSVPEMYSAQHNGAASVETTVVRKEFDGVMETPLIGPFHSLKTMTIASTIPSGASLQTQFLGTTNGRNFDTLVTSLNSPTVALTSVDTKKYTDGKVLFRFAAANGSKKQRRTSSAGGPSLSGWTVGAGAATELAVSSASMNLDRPQVMEGEVIQLSGKIFNVSPVPAESVLVQLRTNASGIATVVSQQIYPLIPANDSVTFAVSYNTRGRRGNHAFTVEIDPNDAQTEVSRSNNIVSLPYIVQADTLRPVVSVTIDGSTPMNGDYVSKHPEIRVRYVDNNPAGLQTADSGNFRIRLNNIAVPFIPGTAELLSVATGKSDVRWTPSLQEGENIIEISAKDLSENYSDTILLYVNVTSDLRIMDLFNLPNPFSRATSFTFTLTGSSNPEEVLIKIFTVSGRLIQEISTSGVIGFNRIAWDGRDKDGDEIGNGLYLYKVIVKQGGKQTEALSKLVKMR